MTTTKSLGKELLDALNSLAPGPRQHLEGEAFAIVVKGFEKRFGPDLQEYFDDQIEFLHSIKAFKKFGTRAYILLGIAFHAGKDGTPANIANFPRMRKKIERKL